MKRLITILFIGVLSTLYSQQQNLNPNLITFPVSPEAARLGSFGNVPVNLFYGQLDKSIELFNGKVGDFNLPINLRYNYAGFRVEESPSMIGLGWQLSLGGVVTREVRSIPDEHPNKGYYAANRGALDSYFDTGIITDYNASRFIEGQFDTEPDKYIVSVNGIYFSFKIGLDGSPVFLSKHNYKLEIIRNPNNNLDITSFILTDTNSNKYFFENKETNESFQGGGNLFDDNFPNYVSSWQLSKIVVNNNSEITFNYQNDDFYNCSYYATGTFRGVFGTEGGTLYNQGSSKDLIKRKILKSINSDSFNILFNIITINDQEVYDKMTITDFKTNVVNHYDFNFAGNRNSLIKINKNNQFFYEFDYMGNSSMYQNFMNSISQFPWNQDEWGFANGASNQYAINIPMSGYTADKRTSFSDTFLGALATIKYPTGGRTQIFYEQNTTTGSTDGNSDTEPNIRINLKFKSDNYINAPEIKESIYTKTFVTDVVATLSHTIESTTQGFIEMSIVGVPDCGSLYDTSNQYYNKIPGQRSMLAQDTPKVCPSLYAALDDGCTTSYCISSNNSSGKFIIPSGTYEFKFKTIQNQYKDVKASITLDFYDPAVAAFTNTKTNRNVGGIRVSKTIDYPIIGNEVTSYYDYNNEDGSSTGIEFGNLINQYNYEQYYTYEATSSGGIATEIRGVTDYSAKSYNPLLKSGIPIYYSRVKEYSTKNEILIPSKFLCTTCGGNFGGNYDGSKVYSYLGGIYGTKKNSYSEGYKMTEFESPKKTPPSEYPFSPNGEDLSTGMISSIKIVDKTDNVYNSKLLFHENDSYIHSTDFGNPNFIDPSLNPNYSKGLKIGYKIKRIGMIPSIAPNKTINDYFLFNIYKESDIESFKSNITTKEYFNNNFIEKNVAIEYDSHNQQSKVTTADSNNNILTNELFYPYNFSDAVSLDMVSKNSIIPLVQVVNKKNGGILESSKFEYGQISNNLFKPFSFSKSKGNNSLEKRNIFNYDSNGNIIATINIYPTGTSPGGATLYDGSTTTIIWGYNKTLPVAKIESSSNITVPATLITAIETASSNTGTEASLLSALNNLRNDTALANAMVTTYTHIPLVGVSTITDPKGDKITYTYDAFGRLLNVKDKNGNILSENEYHFKN